MSTIKGNKRIICAIDTKDINKAIGLCDNVKDYIGFIKLGLEFFTYHGPEGIRRIKNIGIPIFLDLKFHDIPNTVAEAVRSAVSIGVDMLTIHTSGGCAMMKAAVEAAKDEAAKLNQTKPLMLGVTVLTSLDSEDLKSININKDTASQVTSLALLAKECGLSGVVCSPLEIQAIREVCGSSIKLVVPGIRSAGHAGDDQKRTLSAREAVEKGADYLVIGRPITKAENPALAAENIHREFLDI